MDITPFQKVKAIRIYGYDDHPDTIEMLTVANAIQEKYAKMPMEYINMDDIPNIFDCKYGYFGDVMCNVHTHKKHPVMMFKFTMRAKKWSIGMTIQDVRLQTNPLALRFSNHPLFKAKSPYLLYLLENEPKKFFEELELTWRKINPAEQQDLL